MQWQRALFDPGVVVSAVESTESLDRVINERVDIALGSQVGRKERSTQAGIGNGAERLSSAIGRDVGNDNVGSGVGQHNGRLTAYAAAGTGDDDGLTLQDPGHGQSPRNVHRGTEP